MRGLTKALLSGCCLVLAASWSHAGGAEKGPSIRLPPDWFATSIEQRMRPGVLKGPVVEAWRTTCADRGREITHFMVRDPYVYLIRQTEIACLYAATGETFWSWKLPPDEKPGPAWCIPLGPYLLVQTMRRDEWQASADERLLGSTSPRKPSPLYRVYRLLSAQTSEPVLELGTEEVRLDRPLPRPAVPVGPATAPGDRLTALAKELANPSDPKQAFVEYKDPRYWDWLHLCHGTAPDRAPLGNDPAAWSLADVKALVEFLGLHGIPTQGATSKVICATADAWFTVGRGDSSLLRRVNPATAERVWETPVLMDTRFDTDLVVRPPFVALFQQPNAVIAYDMATGRPAWRYEWPFHDGYSHGFAALDDGLLILTDPVREHPAKTLRDPKTGKALGSGADLRLGLIKVDMQGRPVFQQELDIPEHYGSMQVANGFVLVKSGGELVAYRQAPAGTQVPGLLPLPQETAAANAARIQALHAEFEATAYLYTKIAICSELGALGDKTWADRVLADLAAVDPKTVPNSLDFHISMVRELHDWRTFPTLLAMQQQTPVSAGTFSTRMAVTSALQGLIHRDPPDRKALPAWWEAHKHLFPEAAGAPIALPGTGPGPGISPSAPNPNRVIDVEDLASVKEFPTARERYVSHYGPAGESRMTEIPEKPQEVFVRLLDQNDVPVPDALFQCALSGYRFVADRVRHRQKIRVRTDADGRASFVIAPVSWCDSFGADKAGYVYDMDDNAALYGKKPAAGARDMRAPLLQLLASSRAAPTVVRLVNRGKLTLPFGRLDSVEVPLRGAPDNNEGTAAPLFTAEFPKERVWNGALVFTATTDAGGETFTLKIRTGDVTGGLVLSPKVLLEAPDSGYQAQATLSLPTPTKGKSSWLRPPPLVYVRTGSPVLYGRLLLREVVDLGEQSGTRMIRLSCSTNLNAFGGRAVEPIEHRAITGDNGNAVYGMLDEARRTLAAGKVPPEPDWRSLLDVHAAK